MIQLDPAIPASQAILDVHHNFRKKIEIANHAIIDCIKAGMEFDDPIAPALLGADAEVLRALANANKSSLLPLIMIGLPLFSLRTATPEFLEVLANKEGDDAALRVMLSSYGQEIPVSSL